MLPHFIYLDSKIIGTAVQICTFFANDVFDKNKTTILIKKYKHKSNKIIGNIFSKEKICHRFVNEADLDALTDGVIFYPFNAQSNCRAVANRNLTHIFITHGESNKVSSIKPIIRIYDYVITAGQAGIDRYLANNIFSQYDVDSGRIIPLGNTFIGKTGLAPVGVGQGVVFYAPTWEGGIEKENYSSLSYVDKVAKILIEATQLYQTKTLVIKPHPNTGHRLNSYIDHLCELAKIIAKQSIQVIIFEPHFKIGFVQKLILKQLGIKFVDKLNEFSAVIGFCDISAVETQFLNEDIFYYLWVNQRGINNNSLLNFENYLSPHIIQTQSLLESSKILDRSYYQDLKNYVIYQYFSSIDISQRINYLVDKIKD